MKSILQKSNFNPKELLSSFQKDWEILPFPYVVAKPRNLRNVLLTDFTVFTSVYPVGHIDTTEANGN